MRRRLLGVAALVVLAGIVIGGRFWLRHAFPPPPSYMFGTGLHLQSGTSGNDCIALGDAKGRALVVWSNHDGKASSDMHSEHGVLILSGEVAAANGPVPFRCEVPDSRTGTLAIDGNTYDLARGTVFLISAASRPPRVTQLDADVTRLQPGATNEGVVGELKKDPRIQAFFQEALCELDSVQQHLSASTTDLTGTRAMKDELEETQVRERLAFESAKRGRAEAERLGHIKDEFLANLSHEIRTPLNAILGWAQILKPGVSSEKDLAEGLEIIVRNSRIQAKLIDDLLDMSRIISGKMRLDVQRVDLPAVIDAAMESVGSAAQAKGIKLQKVVDPIAGPVSGDPGRLQQIVWNLLSNAVKFTPKNGKVQVVVERSNLHVELSVSDTGKGIAPDYLSHVFERFTQADASATKSNTGLGLGLAIVKSLAELHGGSVRAKSGGEGTGSTFIVSLPVSVVHTLDQSENLQRTKIERTAPLLHTIDLKCVKVIVVDDEADAIALVKRIMEDCGATVEACTSGAQCLARLPSFRPAVLITDIGMPEMDGYTLIGKLRAMTREDGGQTPAIALTAFARSEDRRQAMLAGFDVHVAKPVEPGELVAVVSRLARRNTK